MTPDPAALNLAASWAERMGLPVSLVFIIVTGESGWDLNAEGDGGLAHGGLQVRVDVHGHDRQWWIGMAGFERSFALMAWRWQRAWDRFGKDIDRWHRDPVASLKFLWHEAQGARQDVVNARAEEVVRDGMAIYAAWWKGQQGGSVVTEPSIIWVGANPANFERGRGEISLEAVVWHLTEGGMPGPWFNDPRAQASTNYGISKAGRIEAYVALADTAYAHGSVEVAQSAARPLIQANWGINPNLWAASIEFEGTTADVQAGRVPTPAQKAAAVHLTAWLFATELFDPAANARPTPSRETIGMHRDISPRSRTCPVWGEGVQAEMIAAVQEKLQPPKPDPRPDPQPCPPMDATWLLRVGLARRAAEAALVLSAGEEPHTSAFNAARADALAIVETIDEAGRA